MSTVWEKLNTPTNVCGMSLQNRFVMAPMTRKRAPDGLPTAEVCDYYVRRADSLGMIITEGTYIDHPSAGQSSDVPRWDADGAEDAWRAIVDAVHAKGAVIMPQLWHVGGMRRAGSDPHPDGQVFSPSGRALSGKQIGEPMSPRDIDAVVESFGRSAEQAKRAGFDGVEIHGAHGYLLDQFLWEGTNSRDDDYGGNLERRLRFSQEVVAEIRHRVGPGFPIQFRFSQWKGGRWDATIANNPQELEQILLPLKDVGVDIFHPSTRRFWLPAFAGSDLTLAGWTKQITAAPTILVGHVGVETVFGDDQPSTEPSQRRLDELFDRDEFDLLAIGRALLADPEWVSKTVAGRAGTITRYTKASEEIYY